jgi:hypothetical protein
MIAIFDTAKITLLMLIILGCVGACGFVAISGAGLDSKFEAELTEAEASLVEAEAELTEAEAEEAQRRTEMIEARAELERSKAEAHAIRTQTDELVKHSRLNRRILTLYTIRSQATIFLGFANVILWGIGFYLHWRQQDE